MGKFSDEWYSHFMRPRDSVALFVCVAICELAGIMGGVFTGPSVRTWYPKLTSPALTPPAWIFGGVWPALFILMGIGLYLVWKKGFKQKNVKAALNIFFVQLFLNILWSVVFFGLHDLFLSSIEILLLWASIIGTMVFFYRVSKPAAYMLIPYILWVTFAAYLTSAFAFLN